MTPPKNKYPGGNRSQRSLRNIDFSDQDFYPEDENYDDMRDDDRDYDYDRDYDGAEYDDRDYDDRGYDDHGYDDQAYDDPRYDDPRYDDRGGYDDPRYDDREGYDDPQDYDDPREYDDRRVGYDEPYYPRGGRRPEERPAPAPRPVPAPKPAPAPARDDYRSGYRDGFLDHNAARRQEENNMNTPSDPETKFGFIKRHPILMNLLYAIGAGFLFIWMLLWFVDFWTFHGQERAVPDVKGQSYETAVGNISRAGLRAVVTDSVYDSYARPGTVVEQSPIPLARIKRGGTVYLTLVAFTPKMVTIPDIYDVSERQARSMLEGLGITQIMAVSVPLEYSGLVMGAKFNGVTLRPGAKVPVTAVITLEIGEGAEADTAEELVDTLAIEQTIEALNID